MRREAFFHLERVKKRVVRILRAARSGPKLTSGLANLYFTRSPRIDANIDPSNQRVRLTQSVVFDPGFLVIVVCIPVELRLPVSVDLHDVNDALNSTGRRFPEFAAGTLKYAALLESTQLLGRHIVAPSRSYFRILSSALCLV